MYVRKLPSQTDHIAVSADSSPGISPMLSSWTEETGPRAVSLPACHPVSAIVFLQDQLQLVYLVQTSLHTAMSGLMWKYFKLVPSTAHSQHLHNHQHIHATPSLAAADDDDVVVLGFLHYFFF